MNKDSGPIIPISGIFALLAVIGLSYYSQTPFKATRPYSGDIKEERSETVTARLWQDPFSAVLTHLKAVGKNKTGRGDETISLTGGASINKNGKFLTKIRETITGCKEVEILGVMVPGTEYAEDEEGRMRQRYAVMAGLRNLQFYPVDSEHIQYVLLKTAQKPSADEPHLKEIMPYEWFASTDGRKHILLLWLNEKTFQSAPLHHLSGLKENIKEIKEWKIIGPSESKTLKNMLSELSGDASFGRPIPDNLKGMKIYSAYATADENSLLPDNAPHRGGEMEAIFKNSKGIDFVRTIGSDKILAEAIVAELKNRRAFTRNKTIILISESDTVYAGSLLDVFRQALANEKVDVVYASYLRGIDGILPGQKDEKTDKKDSGNNKTNKTDVDLDQLEKPAGKSQYDYLRRHANKIYHRLERRHRDVAAIGILGSNFHDKYLVLQAFHQRFPQAIYFTTDLDAMWMHPAHLQWTRNLLVASHFGISAKTDRQHPMQEKFPSFRDSYQTSTFTTIQKAFTPPKEINPVEATKPALFEIGNSRAYNLSGTEENKYFFRWLVVLFLIAVIIVGTLFFANKQVNRAVKAIFACEDKEQFRRKVIILLVVAALLVLLPILFNRYILSDASEEPFSFFDGISVWPANIMRMLVFILSACFIYVSYDSLKKNEKEIEHKLLRRGPVQETTGFSKTIQRIFSHDFFKEYGGGQIFTLWDEYVARNRWTYRVCWNAVACLLYFATSLLILNVSNTYPAPPVRGYYSFWITQFIIAFSVVLFSVLFLYVFDATRLCHQMIITLTEKSHVWPALSLEKYLVINERDRQDEQVKLLSEWLTVHLVVQRTKTIDGLIFYPLIVAILMFLARHSYFDNWNTTITLAVILTISVLITWICALILRFDAERFRKAVIKRLKQQQMRLLLGKDTHEINNQIDHVIADIQSIQEGAFVPLSQHPVFRSIMLVLSSIGGTYMIEFLNVFSV